MLLGDYKLAASAWELVALGEKLALTGFLALLAPGSWMQIFAGTVSEQGRPATSGILQDTDIMEGVLAEREVGIRASLL